MREAAKRERAERTAGGNTASCRWPPALLAAPIAAVTLQAVLLELLLALATLWARGTVVKKVPVKRRPTGDLPAMQREYEYHADDLVSGGVMSGVIELFIRADCCGVVSAQSWSVGYIGGKPQGDVALTCPRCGGGALQA